MSAEGKGIAAIVAGVLFIIIFFIVPPAHPQCGTKIFCHFMSLTTVGQIASLSAILLIVLGFSILGKAGK